MGRKRCRAEGVLLPPSELPPRKRRSIIDTPRKNLVLADVETLQGQVTQREIFQRHGISQRSGERILANGASRLASGHKSKRKRLLSEVDLATVETIENASFHHASQRHFVVAQHLGIRNTSA